MLAIIQTKDIIEAVSGLLSNFHGWGGVGAVLVAMAAMPAIAIIAVVWMFLRTVGRMLATVEASAKSTGEVAEALSGVKAGQDESNAKLNKIGSDLALVLEHSRARPHASSGGGK